MRTSLKGRNYIHTRNEAHFSEDHLQQVLGLLISGEKNLLEEHSRFNILPTQEH